MQYTIKNEQFRDMIGSITGNEKVPFMLRGLTLYIDIKGQEEIKLDLNSDLKHTYKCTIHGEVEIRSLINTYNYICKEDNTSPIYLDIDIQKHNNYIYTKNEETGWTNYESITYLNIKHVNHIQNNDNKYTITTEDIRKPIIIEKMANYMLGGWTDEEIESGEGIEEIYAEISEQYDEILYYDIKTNMFKPKGQLKEDLNKKLINMSFETDDDGTFLYQELRKEVYNTEKGWIVDVDDLLEWAETEEIETYLYT